MLLTPTKYEELNREVVDLIETYGFTAFPMSVFELAGKMGIVLRSYSSIPLSKRSVFENTSHDAFTISPGAYEVDTTFICYDQDSNSGRLAQSIAHEIAHIWLEHPSSDEPYETEAEYFAAYLLAPIPLIIANRLFSIDEIHDAFRISWEASRIALERAGNRCSCKKQGYDYEYRIIGMCTLKGGDRLESIQ